MELSPDDVMSLQAVQIRTIGVAIRSILCSSSVKGQESIGIEIRLIAPPLLPPPPPEFHQLPMLKDPTDPSVHYQLFNQAHMSYLYKIFNE
jgi:hypothetical protein